MWSGQLIKFISGRWRVTWNCLNEMFLMIRIVSHAEPRPDEQMVGWFRKKTVIAWMEFGTDSFQHHWDESCGKFLISVYKIKKLIVADQTLFVFFIPRSVDEFVNDLGNLVGTSDLHFVYGIYVYTRSEKIASLMLLAGQKQFDLQEVKEKFPDDFA